MPRGKPYRHVVKGVTDTLDSSDTAQEGVGVNTALQNLIPDPTTRFLYVPRPPSQSLTTFGTFTTPGFISVMKVVGSRVYGMIASGRNAGKEEPFCYDLLASAFVTISGVTAANSPTAATSTGDWTPPTMAVIGTKIIVTHPGFDGAAHFFGSIDISTPASPAWTSGNTATNALPAVPTAVAQFGNRAWYIVNPATGQPRLYYSDVLVPTTITNASQALTFDDNVPLTALAGLPLENQLGGVIQSLIVFKGTANLYQVTGDAALSNLSQNTLNIATGTLCPLSICTTPKGLAFMAPDGMRFIDFNARVSDPIGMAGQGVTIPFIYAPNPSRTVAACNAAVVRVSAQNGSISGNPVQEWWYDMVRDCWTGPHTFPASLVQPYQQTFILTPSGITNALWQSDFQPKPGLTYMENGVQMTFLWKTALLHDNPEARQMETHEGALYVALPAGQPALAVTILDENDAVLDSVFISGAAGTPTLWGSFTWGAASWGAGAATRNLTPRKLAWHSPIVFSRSRVQIGGNCADGFHIGDMYALVNDLGLTVGT